MTALTTYAVGVSVLTALAVAWGAVQLMWRRTVAGGHGDADALAGRFGCTGCTARAHCASTPAGVPCASKENS